MATKKRKLKKSSSKKSKKQVKPKKKLAVKAKAAKAKKKSPPKPKAKARRRQPRGRADSGELVASEQRGLGARSGGQSGDTQGLAEGSDVDSESVEELLEEGQTLEAELLDGVENAKDPDQSEVRTKEVPEDDVPGEYLERE